MTVKCIQFTIVLDKEAWMDHFKINNNKNKGKERQKGKLRSGVINGCVSN